MVLFTKLRILQYSITCIGVLDIDTFVFSLLSVTEEQDSWGDLLGVSLLGKKLEFRPKMPFYAFFHEQITPAMV
jgi:hypothetical protein